MSKLAHPLFIYSVIMKSFIDIIKSKSTEELLDIYNNRYLEYQESFIDLCSEELRRRGVEIPSITLDLPEEMKPQFQKMMEHKLFKGESSINLARKLCHLGYNKEDFEDLLGQAKHQAAILKMENAIIKSIWELVSYVSVTLFILLLLYIDILTGHSSWYPLKFLGACLLIAVPVKIIILIILIIWNSIKIKIKKKNPPTSKTTPRNTPHPAIA